MNFRLSYIFLTLIGLTLQSSLWLGYLFSLGYATVRNIIYLAAAGLMISLVSMFLFQFFSFAEERKWAWPYLLQASLQISFFASSLYFLYRALTFSSI